MILLDTSFLRHLGAIERFDLIRRFSETLNWKFVIPGTVLKELQATHVPKDVEDMLADNTIKSRLCNKGSFKAMQVNFPRLGDGELEALVIAEECKQEGSIPHILSDDHKACRKAHELGTHSHDIIMFLLESNKNGFITKKDCENALDILDESDYKIPKDIKEDYLRNFV